MKIDKGGIINDFIEPNKNQYVIPVYQRNYEWAESDCKKLFDDIVEAHIFDRQHFCGSVIYAPLKEEKKIDYYVVIDGQQRLTTIYLIIKALIDKAQDESEKQALLEAITNTDKFNKYDFDEASKLKLKPIKSDAQQLALLMDGKYDEMDKSSGIWRNYALFCAKIDELFEANPDMGVSNVYDGLEHLTCAVIKIEEGDEESPQQIFERINSTGKPLSLTDKIRNFVLMTDVDQDRLYEEYWLKVEQLLTKAQMEDFFLDYLNMKMEGFARKDTAYDSFKLLYKKEGHTNETILGEVLHYVRHYAAFYNGGTELSSKANFLLASLRQLNQSTAYLFLFRVFDDYEENVIDSATLEKVLSLLVSYSVRRIVCEVGSNSLRGLYKSLYDRVFAVAPEGANYYDAIASFLMQLASKDAIPKDADFEVALMERNLYNKKALCKYLLAAIENRGKEKVVTDNLTIEHIMPQNKNLSGAWQKMLGEDWQSVRERYLHTLGNLTLTGYNSELGDKPFPEKKSLIVGSGTHINVLYSDVEDKEEWNEATIVARAKRLAKLAVEAFPIEKPKQLIEFIDPHYSLYTAEQPSYATGKRVNYYELLGERILVDSFAGMMRSVASKVFDVASDVLEPMAKRGEPFPGWSTPAFSYDSSAFSNPVRVSEGIDIYMPAGLSARDCVSYIKELMKKCDLDLTEDFVYSARES